MSATPRVRVGYGTLLRDHADFRRLWFGEVTSFLGDWFNTIALYTAVQELSDTGQAVAAVMVAKMLPPFLVAPLTGPIIDRFDRRRVLITTNLLRAVFALGLVASYLSESLTGLYACTVVLMAGAGVALPTKNSILPMIVPVRFVAVANAFGGGTWSVMLALGATIGGAATEAFGITASFVIDAVTFLASAGFFLGLPPLPPKAGRTARVRFVDGLAYLRRTPYVLGLTLAKPMMGLIGGVLVLIPIFGNGVFAPQAGPWFTGLLFGARGMGALVGSLGLRMLIGDTPRTLRRAIPVGFLTAAISYSVLSYTTALWQAALCFFTAAVGSATIWVFSGTLLQLEADSEFHGRIFSLEFGTMTLVMAGSSWLAGLGLDHGFEPSQVARIAGAAALLPACVWMVMLAIHRRAIRRAVARRVEATRRMAAEEATDMARSREERYQRMMSEEGWAPGELPRTREPIDM